MSEIERITAQMDLIISMFDENYGLSNTYTGDILSKKYNQLAKRLKEFTKASENQFEINARLNDLYLLTWHIQRDRLGNNYKQYEDWMAEWDRKEIREIIELLKK